VGDEIKNKPTDQTSGSTSSGSGSTGSSSGSTSGSTSDTNGDRLVNNDNPANSTFSDSGMAGSSAGAGSLKVRSLSSETEQQAEKDKEPERLTAQELAVREVRRILGGRDAEAEFAAGSRAAGGFVNTTEAAVTSIVNTNANNLSENLDLQTRVAEAAAAARTAMAGTMQEFRLATGTNFSDEKRQVGEEQQKNAGLTVTT
jgi:hypothetical protein